MLSGSPVQAETRSLFERFLAVVEGHSDLRINLEDYLGILHDIPGLSIGPDYYQHTCEFCVFAKNSRRGFLDCVKNKRAVNRLLQQRRQPLEGLCHLGVTDLVRPVVIDDICVAGLFYGSFILEGTESEARRRRRNYCKRRRLAPRPIERRAAALPHVHPDQLPALRQRLRLASDLLQRLIEDSGVPIGRYRLQRDAEAARRRAGLPPMLQAALRQLERGFPRPITRDDVARSIHCNPNYLSGLFTRHLGMGFTDYLHHLRIERAKTLLRHTDQSAGEIAFAVGYEDQSHFNRWFRKLTTLTPLTYRREHPRETTGTPNAVPRHRNPMP